jgi:hypothetical protein
MKNVMYFYNGIEGEEELHEDDKVTSLTPGELLERAGERWKIIDVQLRKGVGEHQPMDIIKVYLEGPIDLAPASTL